MPYITRPANPASLADGTAWVVVAECDIWDRVLVDLVGDDDLAWTTACRIADGLDMDRRLIRIAACEVASPASAADCIGVASVTLPLADNLDVAEVSIAVRRERRGEGVGSMLLAEARRVADEHGRTKILAWTWEPRELPDGAPALPARTHTGDVAADSASTRFLTRHGFVLNQLERMSRADLPEPAALRQILGEAQASASSDYDCVTVAGPLPDQLLEDVAGLHRAMSTDVPMGELALGEEVWDAARLRRLEAQFEASDRDVLQTFARHTPTGRLAGYTQLVKDRATVHLAFQWDTLILKDHRGHGLGLLVKAVNHQAARAHWPDVESIITGNAEENAHMLAINDRLGFRPYAGAASWIQERAK